MRVRECMGACLLVMSFSTKMKTDTKLIKKKSNVLKTKYQANLSSRIFLLFTDFIDMKYLFRGADYYISIVPYQ